VKILIIKLSAIGDIVHALPAVAAIRRNMPEAHISWVVEQRSAEILRGCDAIDDLIEIDTRSMRGGRVIEEILLDMSKQARLVRQNKYDVAIDLQGLIKSAVIGKISGAKRRWGFSRSGLREPAGRFLLTDTVRTPPEMHVIRKNLHLAAGAFGFEYDDTRLDFPITAYAEHAAEADAIIERTGGRFAILNPGGGWVTKLWHAEKFGRLADRIYEATGMTSVVATGPNVRQVEVGDGTMRWSAISEIWRFRDFWLLSFSKSQFITLPLADLTPDMQACILQKARAAGAKVDR